MTKSPQSLLHLFTALMLCACGTPPGRPAKNSEVVAPDQVLDFATLFGENCAGCHGANGQGGAAVPLSDPVYLAIADANTIRKTISRGVSGTPMAAFAQSAGGMLTDKQVDVLVTGIFSHWSKPGILNSTSPPAYSSNSSGDSQRGAADYKTFCESCHGPGGKGGPKASSIVDPAFLSLISDQDLRTLVIVGRPELGAPDWRGNVPGRPMSDQEITDVVTWLAQQRPANATQKSVVAKEPDNAR